MSPLETSAFTTDPNIVQGPRKRRPPAHFADEGDPIVARKKARPVVAGGGQSTKTKSVPIEEDTSDVPHPRPLTATPTNQSLDDSDDACSRSGTPKPETIQIDTSDEGEVPEKEDDVTELSKFSVPMFLSC
jgi:hypothetical protein